jgi:DNA-binding transcriptional LysR family regulator
VQWDDVRIVLSLLRAPKLADAAASLGLDASTLSRRIAKLEEEMGTRLFTRTRDGLRPTAVAERMRARAEAMEADAAALVHTIRADEPATGTVRLATTESFARLLVVSGLLDLRASHPDLVIELLGENRPVDLARGEADLAIRLSALRQPTLRARCVGKTGVGLFAAATYLRAHRPIRGPSSLRGHELLLPGGELARLPEARWLASIGDNRVVLKSNSMPALVAAAVAGHGIVPLPIGWGDSEPGLVRVMTLDDIPERKIWLVTHDAAAERPAVIAVSKHVADIIGRMFASAQSTIA